MVTLKLLAPFITYFILYLSETVFFIRVWKVPLHIDLYYSVLLCVEASVQMIILPSLLLGLKAIQ